MVRLFVTDAGRRKCDEALAQVAPGLSGCLAFADPADQPVIRKFLVETSTTFGDPVREERK